VYRDAADVRHGFVRSESTFSTIDVPAARSLDGSSVTGINDRRDGVGGRLERFGQGCAYTFLARIPGPVLGCRVEWVQ
jgi:hypothetical protein